MSSLLGKKLGNNFSKITKVRQLNDEVYRNIVSLRVSENLFDDLIDDAEDHSILVNFEMRHKNVTCHATIKERGFYYSTAVEYPFNSDNFMASRYSDATYPAWYSSLSLDTTIYETLHWMINEGLAIEQDWTNDSGILHRERAVYQVGLECMAFDLVGLEKVMPELIHSSDYSMTQMIGKKLHQEGARGIIYTSARSPNKEANIVIFDINAINAQPKLLHYLTYKVDFIKRIATVYREPDKVYLSYPF